MGRRKRRTEPEYRLRIFHHHFDRKPRPSLVVAIETTKEFVSFQYEVLLEDRQDGREFLFRILGLHAPGSVMPAVGPARGIRVFDDVSGRYWFRIAKPDGEENVFSVRISERSIKILDSPGDPFVVVSTQPIPLSS